jgi:hypothetical protein
MHIACGTALIPFFSWSECRQEGVGAKLGQSTERSGGWLDTYSDSNSKPAGEPEPCARVHWVKGDCCLSKRIGLPQFLDAAPADRESALGWGLFSGFSSNRNTQVLGSCRLNCPIWTGSDVALGRG